MDEVERGPLKIIFIEIIITALKVHLFSRYIELKPYTQ